MSADGSVGVSGKPTRIFAMNLVSGAGSGDLVLRNGSAASGTIYLQFAGVASTGQLFTIDDGVFFPGGCFYDHEANNTHVSITYEQERR